MILYTAQALVFELIQVRYLGMAYFLDPQNYVEALQIVTNIIFIGMKLSGIEHINVYFALTMVSLSMIKLNF